MTEQLEPCTPDMLAAQLDRIGLSIKVDDIKDWSEPMCSVCFEWAVLVDMALIDGVAVQVTARPEILNEVLEPYWT